MNAESDVDGGVGEDGPQGQQGGLIDRRQLISRQVQVMQLAETQKRLVTNNLQVIAAKVQTPQLWGVAECLIAEDGKVVPAQIQPAQVLQTLHREDETISIYGDQRFI